MYQSPPKIRPSTAPNLPVSLSYCGPTWRPHPDMHCRRRISNAMPWWRSRTRPRARPPHLPSAAPPAAPPPAPRLLSPACARPLPTLTCCRRPRRKARASVTPCLCGSAPPESLGPYTQRPNPCVPLRPWIKVLCPGPSLLGPAALTDHPNPHRPIDTPTPRLGPFTRARDTAAPLRHCSAVSPAPGPHHRRRRCR